MTSIEFKPWIGKNFEKDGFEGLKILILGEAQYGDIM